MARVTSRAHRLLAVAVLLAAAALASSSGLAQAATAPTKRYVLPDFGVSIAVPASWNAKDYRDPVLYQQFGGAYGPTVKLAGQDPRRRQGFLTTFAVIVAPADPSLTLEAHARRELAPYRRDPTVTIVGSSKDFVELAGGRAWRLKVRFAGAANGGATVTQLQYHMLRGKRLYVFSYVTLQALENTYAAAFDASSRSIRFPG